MNGRIECHSDMLDARQWLKHHTWIQWHIRDERGHLKALSWIMSQKTKRTTLSRYD